jgi:hypothetical protein
MSHHSLLTKRWSSTPVDDVAHWRRLEPFRDLNDESYAHPETFANVLRLLQLFLYYRHLIRANAFRSQERLAKLCEKYVLMRWKGILCACQGS